MTDDVVIMFHDAVGTEFTIGDVVSYHTKSGLRVGPVVDFEWLAGRMRPVVVGFVINPWRLMDPHRHAGNGKWYTEAMETGKYYDGVAKLFAERITRLGMSACTMTVLPPIDQATLSWMNKRISESKPSKKK